MRRPATDVHAIIIGGGPGGATSALTLARLGWRVMLVERGPLNRHKTCGHCLNHRAMDSLRRAGLASAIMAGAVGQTRTFRVHGVDGISVRTSLPIMSGEESKTGLVVDRGWLDQLLRDRAAEAGATIVQPGSARIQAVNEDDVSVHITAGRESFVTRTRLLIGADGVGSSVARAAGLVSRRGTGRKYGFSFDVSDAEGARAFERQAIEMFLVPGGYLGVVSHGRGRLHVAALVDGRATDDHQPQRFVQAAAMRHARLRDLGLHRMNADDMQHLKAIGPMPWRPRKIVRSIGDAHVALVGDAAGYIEPFTGEGIGWALASADALHECAAAGEPGQWTATHSRQYAQLWKRTIGRRQRLCRALAWTLERPMIAGMMLRLAARLPRLADRVAAEVVTA